MPSAIQIGIIGDFDPQLAHPSAHQRRPPACGGEHWHGDFHYVDSDRGARDPRGISSLEHFSGIWCSPGSPYSSMEGALGGIQFARERGYPFIGT